MAHGSWLIAHGRKEVLSSVPLTRNLHTDTSNIRIFFLRSSVFGSASRNCVTAFLIFRLKLLSLHAIYNHIYVDYREEKK